MAVLKLPTTFNIDLEFEVPEFHRRMFAWMIDLILQVFYLIIVFKIYDEYVRSHLTDITFENDPWIQRILILPVIIYHIVCEITMNGQSVGKRLLGIRIVNENGGKASISQFLIRSLIRTSDYMILIIIVYGAIFGPFIIWLLLGSVGLLIADIILVVSSKKNQRLGDILAHTILVNTRPKGSMEETVFIEVADNYVPVFPQIMKLSDRDINAIKNILDTARKKNDFNLAFMAGEKIKSHLKIDSSMSPFDFLDTLLRDYNYLSVK
jgi:uncharacterized RDD family membrane protein YckC